MSSYFPTKFHSNKYIISLIYLSVFLASIEEVIVINFGARFQLYILCILFASTLFFICNYKSVFKVNRLILVLMYITIIGFLLAMINSIGGGFDNLSQAKIKNIILPEFRILLTFFRMTMILMFLYLLNYFIKADKIDLLKLLMLFNYGALFAALYGLYSFIFIMFDMKDMLLPGTWGTYGGRINNIRVSSFFYEPSQFGWFCSIQLLISFYLRQLKVYSRRKMILFSVIFIIGMLGSASTLGFLALSSALVVGSLFSLFFLRNFFLSLVSIFLIIAVVLFSLNSSLQLDSKFIAKYSNSISRLTVQDDFDTGWKKQTHLTRIQHRLSNYDDILIRSNLIGNGLGTAYFDEPNLLDGNRSSEANTGFYSVMLYEFGFLAVLFCFMFFVKSFLNYKHIKKYNFKLAGLYLAILVCFAVGLGKYRATEHLWIWVVVFFLVYGFNIIGVKGKIVNQHSNKVHQKN